ncbi:MAG: ATP-dependent zinc protease [Pseudomonadales bacterium RIFCSPLOWO2_12_59_9]|uniref:retropepsin-like aspartic peptidase RloA2 n=1 Tax=Pseudomonas sp. TaxID=306 RepID=UPI0008B1BAD0|nr:ATP-dependent zinc protease [Pseudomonas sp.]OHC35292.1 MAG: ATP-dependent zinc protease [Pseudomonadales bacterium RIFCSPLOWO2_12_59_9]
MKVLLALLTLVALPALAAEPTLYGRYEKIGLPELKQTLKAKMDTGAYTASLSARDIELFKRDGEEWVRFRLAAKGFDDTRYEHLLARISKIKNRADENDDEDAVAISKRPVIDLQLCLGTQLRTVEVNLVDRSGFNYPLLIGAKALRELDAAIDPAKRFTAGKPDCK